ncbi:Rieske (2Fe-2S) protein [Dinghuibacter silviterrae]|uniref:3-phenylpropionate/trans-cinnamate dioxygenase ferredoxin subunit n=1 Tax=Dinghuibacter silviterrae TaxID=1539049 RepID=A0A4R8DQX6_9BACT|nr:Rieske 2Fe-2S domain-containing protein [Dinghuibacter silviterrae]TDW99726.1 3-phenylpropionate/trans-cinnamate dioxygenase ferredoxin subunit [Dinghuibacter silviterrae]
MSTVRWVRIASTVEELPFGPEGLTELEAGGKHLCLALNGGHVYACAHKCPHAGGHLAEGYTDAMGNIVCPLHRYKFSLATGRNTSGEGYFLRTYPVEVRPDGVYVGFEEKKWLW